MAGTPAHWRTAESDADRNPEFLDVWLTEFDAISPWTVGRFTDERGAGYFAETKMKGDVELINKRNAEGARRKIDYIPVVLPGGSVRSLYLRRGIIRDFLPFIGLQSLSRKVGIQ